MLKGRVHLLVLWYRWFALVAGTVGYILSGAQLRWPNLVVLGIALLYALALTLWALLRQPQRWPWAETTALDVVLGSALLVVNGGVDSPFILYYLIPVLDTALWGALPAAIGTTAGLALLYPGLAALAAHNYWPTVLSNPRFLVGEGLFILLGLLVLLLIGPVLRWREQEGEFARYEKLFSLSGKQRPGVIAVMTEEVLRTTEAGLALFFLGNPEAGQLELQLPDPFPMATISPATLTHFSWDNEFLKSLALSGSPALLVGEQFDRFPVPAAVRSLFGQQPFLAAPLVLQERTIGLVLVGRRGSRKSFDGEALTLLAELAGRMARLVGWTDSLYSLCRRYADLSAANDVLRTINSPRRLEDVLQRVVISAREVLEADRVSVMLLDDKGERLYVRAMDGVPFAQPPVDGVPVGQGISGWVLQHGQLLSLGPGDAASFRSEREREVRQALCVPLRSEEQVIGVLNLALFSANVPPFDQNSIHLAQLLADVAAVAIVKADLMEKVLARTRDLALANHELSTERNKLAQMIGSMAEGVIVLDAMDRLVLVNDAAAASLGWDRPTTIGLDMGAYLREQGLTELESMLRRIHEEGVTLTNPLVYRGALRAGSERTYELAINPVCAEKVGVRSCEGAVAVVRDVTVQLQEEEARADFISTLARDLRTPLTSIKGYLDLLLDGQVGELAPQQEEFLGRASYNVDRAVERINSMLDLSRLQEGNYALYFEQVAVPELVRQVTDLIQPQVTSKQLDLRLVVPPRLPPIMASQAGLRQVLLSLLDNAVKHTSAQGQVFLRVEDQGPKLRFAVQDSGVGISAEMRNQIFSLQGSRDSERRVGLGLYISKRIVEAHGGTIWFESETGQGSVFFFTLDKDPSRSSAAVEGA